MHGLVAICISVFFVILQHDVCRVLKDTIAMEQVIQSASVVLQATVVPTPRIVANHDMRMSGQLEVTMVFRVVCVTPVN